MRLVLLVELLLYLVTGYLLRDQGWHIESLVASMLGMAIGVRGLLVAITYGFSSVWASAPPLSMRGSVLTRLLAVLQEWLAILAISFAVPFETYLMGSDRLRQPADDRPPLLLIHGYLVNRGFWFWIRHRLEARGWVVATLNLEPAYADVDSYAELIALKVQSVVAATGSDQLILVGHSMGGLASRAYLRKYGNQCVKRLITLGSPHHGTRLASIGWGLNAKQMCIGSPWLSEINAAGSHSLPDSVAVFSYGDNFVMPQETARLEGAKTIAVPAVGHVGMAISPSFAQTLIDVLEAS